MVFIAIHTHTSELCPSDNPAPMQQLFEEQRIKESGVKVVATYAAPPEHTIYFVLEADDYAQVASFFGPVMKVGTHNIVPVLAGS